MIDLKLDSETHDLFVAADDLLVVDEAVQVEQNLKIRLLFYREEWFLDTIEGMPFFTDILVKNPNIPNIENIIKAIITDTPGVEELLEFNSQFNRSTRSYTVDFRVRTASGSAELSLTLP